MTDRLLADTDELSGEVVGVWFADDATGFAAVEIAPDSGRDGLRCTGPLAGVVEGQSVRLVGQWNDDERWGETFRAVYYELRAPQTRAALSAHLRGPHFEHIDRDAIERVLDRFGLEAVNVIADAPGRLAAEADVDPAVADELHHAWSASVALADLLRLVASVDWPFEVARAVHAHFGPRVVDVARDEPYRLLAAPRVRFGHVDRLARAHGIADDDPARLAAGALAAIRSARRDGHEHVDRVELCRAAARLLGVDVVAAGAGIDGAEATGLLEADRIDDHEVLSTPEAFARERGLARTLVQLASARPSKLGPYAAKVELDGDLTDDQRDAVHRVFAAPVSVLVGGPGTGKTRTVEQVVRAVRSVGLEVAVCAPTGRAAKRLEEMTGSSATTVHRLLEARPDGSGGFDFTYGLQRRLPHDLVIVDEVSMCDTWLTSRLVEAIDDGSHLLLVGDPDQLPSVGPGDVLRDIVRSAAVPTSELRQIHRQAAGSRIVALARDVLAGEVGELPASAHDVYFAEERSVEAITARVVRAVVERVPERLGVTPDEVQVLAPMYAGPAGVDALNVALKAALNPAGGRGLAGFEIGDRVMQTRNDIERQVANGDLGYVVDVDRGLGTLRVGFPKGEVAYTRTQVRDLVHAWAVTVHKSQGGEWPVVVLVTDASHRRMLWRNLLYTAITRARRALIVVGQRDTFAVAAATDGPADRRTGLAERLLRASENSPVASVP